MHLIRPDRLAPLTRTSATSGPIDLRISTSHCTVKLEDQPSLALADAPAIDLVEGFLELAHAFGLSGVGFDDEALFLL